MTAQDERNPDRDEANPGKSKHKTKPRRGLQMVLVASIEAEAD